MSKNVPTNVGSGGDSIYTEQPGGTGPVFGVTKIYTGALDVNGGPVTAANPLDVRTGLVADTTASGAIAAAAANVALTLAGQSAVAIQITGTWVGTLQFEATVDGATWQPINGVVAGTATPSPTTASGGLFRLTPAGFAQIRVNATAWTSGTATVTIRASVAAGGTFLNQSLTAGTNIIGSVKITDGTTVPAVKAASTLVAATDPALVVALSPLGGEVSVTGSLNALNAALTIDAKGHAGVSLFITSGTLVGTLIFECSGDGGATWGFTYASEWTNGIFSTTFAATSPNTAGDVITLVMLGGISLYRVRVTAYTSGSMTASLRANDAAGGVANFTNYPGFGAPPYSSMMGAQDGAALIQNLQVRPSTQAAGVQGLIVRPYQATDGTNLTPTMDAAARKGFHAITDGTNTAAVLTANPVSASPGLVVRPMFPTDGTNVQPAMAGLSTRGFQQITDGTNSAVVKAASTAAAATDPALVVAISPNNTVPVSAASLPLPTGAATSANQTTLGNSTTKLNDGTNTAAVKAASTAAATTDPALVVAVSPNTAVKIVQQNATAGQTNVAASASSVTLLASNANRKGAMIVNDSASVLYVLFGATASTTVFSVKMQPGDYYEVPFGYTGIIVGIWVTATGSARMTEIT